MNEGARAIKDEVAKVIVGKDDIIEKALAAILAGGHVLLEDLPGVGKTTLALAFSRVMGLEFNRVQFTPDVVPSDITGFSMYDKQSGQFSYKPGAAMCNFFLADEINRTSSKTQSALLEVMQEGKMTVDGQAHFAPQPFIVMATQNPIGTAGTQMLPEAQLDRFMMQMSMGYPDKRAQVKILMDRDNKEPLDEISQVCDLNEIIQMKNRTSNIYFDEKVMRYVVDLAEATRASELTRLGVSPRGALSLMSMGKAYAFVQGESFVTPDTIRAVFLDVCRHRIILNGKAHLEEKTKDEILSEIIARIEPPIR